MTTPNAFFIKQKVGFWEELRRNLAYELNHPDNVMLYVPDKFVLGMFEEDGNSLGFKLDSRVIQYFEDSHTVAGYKKAIDDKRFEVLRTLALPDVFLDNLVQHVKTLNAAKNKVYAAARSLETTTESLDRKYLI
ncbi:MAG: hypothetical protein AABX39_04910 [Nanoarchaeota archaeon]